MKTLLPAMLAATVLTILPAVSAPAQTAAITIQPRPPAAVTYEVWGFRWDGRKWVKQADHSFTTTDRRQAINYVRTVNSYPGWRATTNCPMPPARPAMRSPFGNIRYGNIDVGGLIDEMLRRANDPHSRVVGSQIDDGASDVSVPSPDAPVNDDWVRAQQQSDDLQNMINTQNTIDTENAVNSQLMNDQMNAAATQAMVQALSQ